MLAKKRGIGTAVIAIVIILVIAAAAISAYTLLPGPQMQSSSSSSSSSTTSFTPTSQTTQSSGSTSSSSTNSSVYAAEVGTWAGKETLVFNITIGQDAGINETIHGAYAVNVYPSGTVSGSGALNFSETIYGTISLQGGNCTYGGSPSGTAQVEIAGRVTLPSTGSATVNLTAGPPTTTDYQLTCVEANGHTVTENVPPPDPTGMISGSGKKWVFADGWNHTLNFQAPLVGRDSITLTHVSNSTTSITATSSSTVTSTSSSINCSSSISTSSTTTAQSSGSTPLSSIIPMLQSFSGMTIGFSVTNGTQSVNTTETYVLVYRSAAEYKFNMTYAVPSTGVPQQMTAWIATNGTLIAFSEMGTNYTGGEAFFRFFALASPLLEESLFSSGLLANISPGDFHVAGQSNVTLGPTEVSVTAYEANSPGASYMECTGSLALKLFAYSIGSVSGVPQTLVTYASFQVLGSGGGQTLNETLILRVLSLTKA